MPPLTHWLGIAARQAREESRRTLMDMVTAAGHSAPGHSQANMSRFEHGEVSREATETLAAVYERELGLEHRELWRRAIELERLAGEPPDASGT